MNAPLYTIEVLRLAASLPDPVALSACEGRASERSLTCGSTVATEVALGEAGRVSALSQRVHACAFGQASAALVARHGAGRTRADIDQAIAQIADWLEGSRSDLPDWPDIGAIAPARSRRSRHAAVLLPFRALRAAIEAAQA